MKEAKISLPLIHSYETETARSRLSISQELHPGGFETQKDAASYVSFPGTLAGG